MFTENVMVQWILEQDFGTGLTEGWRRSGLMVSAVNSGVSGLGLNSGRAYCVVILGKTLHSHMHCLSPHRCINRYRRIHCKETGISSGLMSHLARMQTFNSTTLWAFFMGLTSASKALTYRDAFMVDRVTWLSSSCWKTSSVALQNKITH